MIAPSSLRSFGIVLVMLGVAAFLIGILVGNTLVPGNIPEATNLVHDTLVDPVGMVRKAEMARFLTWGGSIAAAVGLVLWIVGYLKDDQSASMTQTEWQYRRIAGRLVQYRHPPDGEFSVAIGGELHRCSHYEELEEYVRRYKPWSVKVERVSGKTYQYRSSADGTIEFKMYNESRRFDDAASMRQYLKQIARSSTH